MMMPGEERWHTSNINQILRNEKYIGDALLQKTYTVDFLTKKRVKNNGIVPQYYVENSHEAIIPRDIFMQVQEELIRCRIVHTTLRYIGAGYLVPFSALDRNLLRRKFSFLFYPFPYNTSYINQADISYKRIKYA